jgi:hypothetical protein
MLGLGSAIALGPYHAILVAGNIIDAAEQAECISGFSSFLHRY